MKKFINFASGFTIAELLISLLISAVIAAAMVPVIGLKKIKVPRMVYHHGIAECYYEPVGQPDENGDYSAWRLMYYYADNNKNKDTQPVPVTENNYCTFTPPVADYFEITAIGPGTDGAADALPSFAYTNGQSNASIREGFIRVDENFQNDISAAYVVDRGSTIRIADDIRRALKEWAESNRWDELFAEYLFDSPLGASTSGVARQQMLEDYNHTNNCHCSSSAVGTDCPGPYEHPNHPNGFWTEGQSYDLITANAPADKCWFWIHASGHDSGKGRRTNNPLKFYLTYNTDVRKTSTTIAATEFQICSTRGNSGCQDLKLGTSGNGGFTNVTSSGFEHPTETATDAPNCEGTLCPSANALLDATYINLGGTHGGTYGYPMAYAHKEIFETKGVIYYSHSRDGAGLDYDPLDPKKLKWTYNAIEARPTAGYAGNMGTEHTIVYEKLRGKLYLRPAPYEIGDNDGITLVAEDLNDSETTLVSASGGIDKDGNVGKAGTNGIMQFPLLTADMPIPPIPLSLGKPTNEFVYQPKVEAARYSGGLKNCATQNPEAIWCPGYAGNGQYFYVTDVPPGNSMSLINLYNNKSFTISSGKILTQAGVDDSNPLCDDGVTVPIDMQPVSYTGPNGTLATFTPKYCQERKKKGNPGAVIIMW